LKASEECYRDELLAPSFGLAASYSVGIEYAEDIFLDVLIDEVVQACGGAE
jgi:hypothetical protein